MDDLARRCTDWVMAVLEAHVGAAQAVTGEAYALTCEQYVGLGPLDHEVLIDRLVAASLHLSSFIKAMLPEGQEDTDAIAALVSRHRPRVEWRASDPRRYMANLLRVGLRHATKARRLLERTGRDPESRVLKSITAARLNLRVAAYLTVERRRRDENIETVLRECRDLVRRRQGGGGEEVTAV
jgi:hypothetical protein